MTRSADAGGVSGRTANAVERFAERATAWTERWMPDAFVFALAATFVVLVAAWAVDPAVRQSPIRLVDTWGAGFWALIPFTLRNSSGPLTLGTTLYLYFL